MSTLTFASFTSIGSRPSSLLIPTILFSLFFCSTVYAQEICGNGIDDNNNGFVDEYCAVPAITCSSGPTAPDLTVPSGAPFIVNTYYPAPSTGETILTEGSTSIPLDPANVLGGDPIAQGDLILIIQMQGASINTGDQDEVDNAGAEGDYGDGDGLKDRQGILNAEYTAGIYEFAFASSDANGGTVSIVSPLRNTYVNSDNIAGGLGIRRYQVVRIPRYNNLTVPAGAILSGNPWDGRRGGIVAVEVLGTMSVNGQIDMTGRGFRGGYRFSDTEFGYKGEGLVGTPPYVYNQIAGGVASGINGYPGTTLGVGAPGNAGGGPREVDSGGGGGAGAGDGGDGAVGPFNSSDPRNGAPYRARGGAGVADAGDRLILGGGGGGGNADNAGFTEVAASGGAGGGIVIVRANALTGNGLITANGEGGEVQPQEGAGGGGGGGSVLLYTSSSNLNTLIIEAQGGEGHSTELHTGGGDGGGGGGGGGRVLLMNPTGVPVSTVASVSGGQGGRGGRWFFSGGADTHENGLTGSPGFVAEVPPPPPFSCPEECGDGVDNDGDGLIDELDPDCPLYTPSEPSCDDPLITYYMPSVWRNTIRGRPQALIISTEFAQANVSIETADGFTFVQNVNVVVGTPVFINIPDNVVESNNVGNVERNKGLIIRSDFPIKAAYLVNNRNNKIILSIKGTASLGKAFRVVTPTRISDGDGGERQFVSVMASEDNTQVNFSDSPYALQGVTLPLTITLNRGETYMLKTQEGSAAELQGPLGMLITSDKPITVNTGCQHMEARGTTSREGGMDQAIPFERLGTEYVCIRGGINAVQDYVIVMGVENNTNIFLDGNPNPIAKIDAGTAFEVDITGNLGDPHYIRANKPIYAYHITGLGGGGEFGMSILPPINPYTCVGSKYSEFLRFGGIANHAYAIVPNAGLADLRLNGNLYTVNSVANPVPGLGDYSVVNWQTNDLVNGINVVQSSEPLHLGLIVGDSGDGGTYGFFTEYQAKVKALDPDILLPTEYYLVDTVCAEEVLTHTILAESCDPFHEIIGVENAMGTVDFQAGSMTFDYTAPSDSMLDIFKVRFRNGLGLTGQVCLGIFVAPKPEPTVSQDTTICEGESVPLLASGGISYSWDNASLLSDATIPNPIATPLDSTLFTVTVTNDFQCSETDSVNVFVNVAPPISAGNDTSICEGESLGLLATGGLTYTWSPGLLLSDSTIADPIATPLTTTTFTVIGRDNAGCENTDEIEIILNPAPTVVAGNDTSICFADTLQLEASGALSYTWETNPSLSDTGIPNPLAFPTTDTEFIVTGVDGNGCEANDSMIIQVLALPIPMVSNDTAVCEGDRLQLQAGGGVSYLWSPSTGLTATDVDNPGVLPAMTTRYIVEVTDANGCSDTTSTLVEVFGIPTAFAGDDRGICEGDLLQLEGSGGNTYEWFPANLVSDANIANPTASLTADQQFVLRVSNAVGCDDTDTVNITLNPLPTITAEADIEVCLGSSAPLGVTGGVSYTWLPEASLSDPTAPNPLASPFQNTVYIVVGTDANGCSAQDSQRVNILSLPNIDAGQDAAICEGETILLTATGAQSYSWSPSVSLSDNSIATPVASPVLTTTYLVEGPGTNGCVGRDSVQVVVSAKPVGSIVGDTLLCIGDRTELLGAGAEVYSWSAGSTSASISLTPISDTPIWMIPETQGCTGDTVFATVRVFTYPDALFSVNLTEGFAPLEVGFINGSVGATSYSWDFGDGGSSTDESPFYIYNKKGTYTVNLVASNEGECTDSVSFSFISVFGPTFYLPNAFSPNNDGRNDLFVIPSVGLESISIVIYDRWGRVITESNALDFSWDGTSEGKLLPEGTYVIQVEGQSLGGEEISRTGTITLFR